MGAFLAESGVEPTDVFCGSLVRQRESARLAAQAAGEIGPSPWWTRVSPSTTATA